MMRLTIRSCCFAVAVALLTGFSGCSKQPNPTPAGEPNPKGNKGRGPGSTPVIVGDGSFFVSGDGLNGAQWNQNTTEDEIAPASPVKVRLVEMIKDGDEKATTLCGTADATSQCGKEVSVSYGAGAIPTPADVHISVDNTNGTIKWFTIDPHPPHGHTPAARAFHDWTPFGPNDLRAKTQNFHVTGVQVDGAPVTFTGDTRIVWHFQNGE